MLRRTCEGNSSEIQLTDSAFRNRNNAGFWEKKSVPELCSPEIEGRLKKGSRSRDEDLIKIASSANTSRKKKHEKQKYRSEFWRIETKIIAPEKRQ